MNLIKFEPLKNSLKFLPAHSFFPVWKSVLLNNFSVHITHFHFKKSQFNTQLFPYSPIPIWPLYFWGEIRCVLVSEHQILAFHLADFVLHGYVTVWLLYLHLTFSLIREYFYWKFILLTNNTNKYVNMYEDISFGTVL